MKPPKWRIYYGDGSTFSNKDGTPFDAPPPNVQLIAVEAATPQGFVLIHGRDYYCWDRGSDSWKGTDTGGFWDYILLATGPKAILAGRTIRDELYFEIILRATKEGTG